MGNRRILIVTATMGNGHVQVSEELRRRLAERGDAVEVVDFNALLPRGVGAWLQRLYPWLVNRAPWLYDLIYRHIFQGSQRSGGRAQPAVLLAMRRLREAVRDHRPDVVVSTYHLAALAAGRLRHQGRLDCPSVSFITTFAVHNLWIHPGTDVELCISEAAARDAERRSGRPARVCGPVVRDGFTRAPADTARVRGRFGIPQDARVALVVAGSLGLGSVESAAAAIDAASGWVPVVVCGRNTDLYQRMRRRLSRATVLPWVDDMAGLMNASDVLVENAGGLSSKEALRCGLPVVTFRPIAGHGRDDAEALARLGLTDVVDTEDELLAALRRLARDPAMRQRRIDAGQDLFRADPAEEIESLVGLPSPDTTIAAPDEARRAS